MSVKVKFCGLTRTEDVQIVCDAGADFCGVVVEVLKSPRSRTREQAKLLFEEATVAAVVVTRSKPLDELIELVRFLSPFALQLHGDETPELVAALRGRVNCQIWKALPLPPATEHASAQFLLKQTQNFAKAGCDVFVLDTVTEQGFGGTGVVASWELAADLVRLSDVPCFLAGGLTPENVAEAVIAVKPYGVDVSSGVEASPGVKDPEKVRLFCQRAKQSL
jgi:phosphoribosylanthranilate isomerase